MLEGRLGKIVHVGYWLPINLINFMIMTAHIIG